MTCHINKSYEIFNPKIDPKTREEVLKLPSYTILNDDTLISVSDLREGDIIVAVDRSTSEGYNVMGSRYVSPDGQTMPWRRNNLGNVVFGPGILDKHSLAGTKVWIRGRRFQVPSLSSLSGLSDEALGDLSRRVDAEFKARAEKVEKRRVLAREIASRHYREEYYREEYPYASQVRAPKWAEEAVEEALRTEDPSK